MTTTKDVLMVEAATQLEGIARALAALHEGPLTTERAEDAVQAIRQHVESAADALQAIELYEAGQEMGVAL
jgi:hypothetical protein